MKQQSDNHAKALLLVLAIGLFACGNFLYVACQKQMRADSSMSSQPVQINQHNNTPYKQLGERAPLKLPLVEAKIVISKSRRQLTLYSKDEILRTYPVALGFNPRDDKQREGDKATPEGEFYVGARNPNSKFYLSLGLNYPNAEHAKRGLRNGLINKFQYEQIIRALQNKIMPPQNTALGGDIYIHGGGTTKDWTWGCVALDSDDIRELFAAIPLGTPVIIEH
ncbi:MAG: hypothetical protein NVSMB56_19730 [Pyrinomonadaceae bacterium]